MMKPAVYGRKVEPRLDLDGHQQHYNMAHSAVSSGSCGGPPSSAVSTQSSFAGSTQTLQEEHYLNVQKTQQVKYQQQLHQQQLDFHRRQIQEPVMTPNKYSQRQPPQTHAEGNDRRRGSSLGDALNSQYDLPGRHLSSTQGNRKSSLLFNRSIFKGNSGSDQVARKNSTASSVSVSTSSSVATGISSTASTSSQSYGLVSRGHSNPLQTSESERINFFNNIQEKFLQLTLSTRTQRVIDYARDITINKELLDQDLQAPADVITIDNILMQLRVLREAILSLPPTDFHKDVLIFSILVSAVYGHYQTYTPAFLTLLNDILPELLDTAQLEDYYREDEFQRVCTIYIYHLVHYADDCASAFQLLGQYYSPESPLYEFIGCWVDRDYFQWRRAFDAERDPALHRMMAFGELTMAKEALARVGRSYLRMDRTELESVLGMDWSRLVNDLHCEWALEGDVVMIRKTK